MGKTKKESAWRALSATSAVTTALFLHLPAAQADPAAKVYLPAVVQGEVELELRGGFQKWRDHDDDRERQFVTDVGYAFTPWWKSELAVGVTRLPGTSSRLDTGRSKQDQIRCRGTVRPESQFAGYDRALQPGVRDLLNGDVGRSALWRRHQRHKSQGIPTTLSRAQTDRATCPRLPGGGRRSASRR